ncbi:MAG: GNAT family N-acetyltransferase [Dehalococcoidia bacterium]|nr:GNAT family N-acetyltransferase [Dehalococcoidia bacterium]
MSMDIAIATFNPALHLDVAASLLAERQRRDRGREPLLPAAFEVPAACRAVIEPAFAQSGWYGVVASAGRECVGFLIGTPQLFPPTHFLASFFPARSIGVSYQSHAASAGREYDVYRAMYAALADEFVRRGYFDHIVSIAPSDAATAEAWASLGFGRHSVAALRDVAPPTRAAADIEVHPASAEDAEVVYALAEELNLHHARAPIYWPYIRESDAASHELSLGLLNDPANAHWIAYEDGRAVGMNTFMMPAFLSIMTVPEETVYLYQGIVTQDARAAGIGTALLARGAAWAREQGYKHIGLHFAAPNLQGAQFWQSSGFKPIEFGIRRHIDERVAWAGR